MDIRVSVVGKDRDIRLYVEEIENLVILGDIIILDLGFMWYVLEIFLI